MNILKTCLLANLIAFGLFYSGSLAETGERGLAYYLAAAPISVLLAHVCHLAVSERGTSESSANPNERIHL